MDKEKKRKAKTKKSSKICTSEIFPVRGQDEETEDQMRGKIGAECEERVQDGTAGS